MLEIGEAIPNARVWTAPGEEVGLRELVARRRTLFCFYLFDWSST